VVILKNIFTLVGIALMLTGVFKLSVAAGMIGTGLFCLFLAKGLKG
jgi:predicted cobalt transporter CbtA